jgi:hypothetical protein
MIGENLKLAIMFSKIGDRDKIILWAEILVPEESVNTVVDKKY